MSFIGEPDPTLGSSPRAGLRRDMRQQRGLDGRSHAHVPSRPDGGVSGALRAAGRVRRHSKLPERNGEYEYRVRNSADANERLARESELQAMSENKAAAAAKGRCVSHRAPQHARVPPVDYGDSLRAGLDQTTGA